MLKTIKKLLNNKLLINICFIIYFIILNYFLFKPANSTLFFEINIINVDKFIHIFIFFILGFITFLKFKNNKNYLIILSLISYGALTELMQGYMNVGRSCELFDFISDIIGFFLSLIILNYIKKYNLIE